MSGAMLMFVHQAGVERADQRAAVLHVKLQPVGFAAGEQVQRGANTSLYLDKSSVGRAKSTEMLRSCSAL